MGEGGKRWRCTSKKVSSLHELNGLVAYNQTSLAVAEKGFFIFMTFETKEQLQNSILIKV